MLKPCYVCGAIDKHLPGCSFKNLIKTPVESVKLSDDQYLIQRKPRLSEPDYEKPSYRMSPSVYTSFIGINDQRIIMPMWSSFTFVIPTDYLYKPKRLWVCESIAESFSIISIAVGNRGLLRGVIPATVFRTGCWVGPSEENKESSFGIELNWPTVQLHTRLQISVYNESNITTEFRGCVEASVIY